MAKSNNDHKANQNNRDHESWQKVNDNRSNQGNRDHEAYWQSRNLPTPTEKK